MAEQATTGRLVAGLSAKCARITRARAAVIETHHWLTGGGIGRELRARGPGRLPQVP